MGQSWDDDPWEEDPSQDHPEWRATEEEIDEMERTYMLIRGVKCL